MREIKVSPKANPLFLWGRKKELCYKGLIMKTDLFVHEQICDLLEKTDNLTGKKRILDWGCGTGALSQRLADLGHDVLSIDMDKDSFGAGTDFECVNFNDRNMTELFLTNHENEFDIVIASEVIEHIHDPWLFLTYIQRVLKDNGSAMVSTPNTGSMISRVTFLRTGNIFQFEETDLEYGHVTPVSLLKMKTLAAETNWKISSWSCSGCLPYIWLGVSPVYWVYSFVSLVLRPFIKGTTNGWCLMFLLEKDINVCDAEGK